MRVAVIVGASLRYCPYAKPYISLFLEYGHEVHLISWVRDECKDIDLDSKVKRHEYKYKLDDSIVKRKKIKGFLGFRKYISKILWQNFDFLIVLDTQFSVLISDKLLFSYKEKYILDMRDLSFEKFTIYRKFVARIVNESKVTFISSDGFRKYLLSTKKVLTTHNIKKEDLVFEGIRNKFNRERRVIRISYWGVIRDIELNKKIIRTLGNDSRFVLNFYGYLSEEAKNLETLCKKEEYLNVHFYGRYEQNERYKFAQNTDVIHNLYSNSNGVSNPAMGNKYYDGVIFRIPQVCMTGGYMGERVREADIGLLTNLDENFADNLFEYYRNIDWNDFENKCRNELIKIIEEYSVAENTLRTIFDVEKNCLT